MNKILTTKQFKTVKELSDKPFVELIEQAGKSIFKEISLQYQKCKVVVLCGIGDNGGDGYAVARYLQENGYDVLVFLNDIPKSLATREMYKKWNDIGGKSINFKYVNIENFAGVDLIIDAMFGSGLNREITGEYKRIIDMVNDLQIQIVSIDLPSGINGDTGEIMGTAIKANQTITFMLLKIAHVIYPSIEYCGNVKIVDIGISQDIIDKMNARITINSPELWKDGIPQLHMGDNKYTRGLTIINSGEMYGASILASKGAKKAGTGIVYITCNDNNYNIVASHTFSDVLKKANSIDEFEELLKDKNNKTILLGCGNGKNDFLKEKIFSSLKYCDKIIFDADAISVFENDNEEKERFFSSIKSMYVFTPHLNEFKKMFKYDENDKIGSVIKAAQQTKSIIVLKGYDTIIASPTGDVVVNNHSSPYLSIAGSGDVLSGLIAGLISRGMEEFKACCCAVWLHGDTSLKINKIFTIEEFLDKIDINSINQ